MKSHVWKWAGAASVALSAGYLLAENVVLRETFWLVVLLGACSSQLVGVRMHRPRQLTPYLIFFISFVFMSGAYLLRFPVWVTPTLEIVGGTGLLVAYSLIAVAVLALVRIQSPGGDREGAIDGAIVLIATATLLTGTAFDLSRLDDDSGLVPRLIMIVAPLLLSAITAATFRLLFVGSIRVMSAWLLVAAAASALAGNIGRTLLTVQGTYERGTAIDLLLIASVVFVAVAGLHPSMATLCEPAETRSPKLTYARLTVLGAALLAAPATLMIQEPGVGISLPIVSSVTLSLLVLWRLARLVIEREAVRQALHERAARQEALAEIGRHALDDPDLAALYHEVAGCCMRLLGLTRCAVVPAGEPVPPGAVAVEVDRDAGALVAVRAAPWNDEDLAFLRSAANVLTGAYRRHEDQETMRHRAVHDPLTGLPNRVLIIDRIEQALARSQRLDDPVSVLFLDLDGFKQINDVYGHQAGDDVLTSVATRLRALLRPADTVGRLAGDEFVVVCDPATAATARTISERIMAALSEPFDLACGTVRIAVSIGLATSTSHTDDAERLLAEADLAMYSAKEQLGSAFVAFDQDVGEAHQRRRNLEVDLARAVEQESLRLVYQPLVAIDTTGEEHTIGVEALLRWDHPVHGPIPPLEFIPLAEATGLILPLGDWVIATAAEQLAAWCAPLPDDLPFTVWVNLSAHQLADRAFPQRVARILTGAGVPAWRFGCEVTESAILAEDSLPVVSALRELGVQLALDDFGTGFSSLSHLRQLTMDLVKIDRSFVNGVTEAGGDRAIVRAVTALARELGVEVLGEGVETVAQLEALHDLGCDLVQGYLLGRPVPADEITAPLPRIAAASSDGPGGR